MVGLLLTGCSHWVVSIFYRALIGRKDGTEQTEAGFCWFKYCIQFMLASLY